MLLRKRKGLTYLEQRKNSLASESTGTSLNIKTNNFNREPSSHPHGSVDELNCENRLKPNVQTRAQVQAQSQIQSHSRFGILKNNNITGLCLLESKTATNQGNTSSRIQKRKDGDGVTPEHRLLTQNAKTCGEASSDTEAKSSRLPRTVIENVAKTKIPPKTKPPQTKRIKLLCTVDSLENAINSRYKNKMASIMATRTYSNQQPSKMSNLGAKSSSPFSRSGSSLSPRLSSSLSLDFSLSLSSIPSCVDDNTLESRTQIVRRLVPDESTKYGVATDFLAIQCKVPESSIIDGNILTTEHKNKHPASLKLFLNSNSNSNSDSNSAKKETKEISNTSKTRLQNLNPGQPTSKSIMVHPPSPNSNLLTAQVDDAEGHFIVNIGSSITSRFTIKKLLGQGTFGRVVECFDHQLNKKVAIKIIKSIQKYRDAAVTEHNTLRKLQAVDPNNEYQCIQLLEAFDYRNHICLVFELYGPSVYDFLKSNSFKPFQLCQVQSISFQLVRCVAFAHFMKLTHTDLKPENVLLVDGSYSYGSASPANKTRPKILKNTEIKLIDFGSSVFESDYHPLVVSTRHYRAPEIILGQQWSYAADMWSIGCIIIELLTGDALFKTVDDQEHMAMIEQAVGRVPVAVVNRCSSKNYKLFFKRNKLSYLPSTACQKSKKRIKSVHSIKSIINPNQSTMHYHLFNLVSGLMQIDPNLRILASEALSHPFFRLKFNQNNILPSISKTFSNPVNLDCPNSSLLSQNLNISKTNQHNSGFNTKRHNGTPEYSGFRVAPYHLNNTINHITQNRDLHTFQSRVNTAQLGENFGFPGNSSKTSFYPYHDKMGASTLSCVPIHPRYTELVNDGIASLKNRLATFDSRYSPKNINFGSSRLAPYKSHISTNDFYSSKIHDDNLGILLPNLDNKRSSFAWAHLDKSSLVNCGSLQDSHFYAASSHAFDQNKHTQPNYTKNMSTSLSAGGLSLSSNSFPREAGQTRRLNASQKVPTMPPQEYTRPYEIYPRSNPTNKNIMSIGNLFETPQLGHKPSFDMPYNSVSNRHKIPSSLNLDNGKQNLNQEYSNDQHHNSTHTPSYSNNLVESLQPCHTPRSDPRIDCVGISNIGLYSIYPKKLPRQQPETKPLQNSSVNATMLPPISQLHNLQFRTGFDDLA